MRRCVLPRTQHVSSTNLFLREGTRAKEQGCSAQVVYLYLDRLQLMLTGEGAELTGEGAEQARTFAGGVMGPRRAHELSYVGWPPTRFS
jgi:hypothetical protein